jgi:hypothetical protein
MDQSAHVNVQECPTGYWFPVRWNGVWPGGIRGNGSILTDVFECRRKENCAVHNAVPCSSIAETSRR